MLMCALTYVPFPQDDHLKYIKGDVPATVKAILTPKGYVQVSWAGRCD